MISWTAFCLCLGILFCVRGLILLCLYPPLEGFDEHQHIAYVASMHEHRAMPRYGVSTIPTSLYGDLVRNPHPLYGWEQLKDIGALPYSRFWSERGQADYGADVMLYSAFYPPLYYRAVAPLYAFLKSGMGFRPAIHGLRILNVFAAGLSVVFFILPLRPLFLSERRARLAALAISLVPIYLVYVVRVGCDAAALVLCSLIFYTLAGMRVGEQPYLRAALAGALLGVGCLVRVSVLAFLPVALIYVVVLLAHRGSFARLSLCLLVMAAPFAALSHGYFSWCVRTYGMLLPGQESLAMAGEGKGIIALLPEARVAHCWTFFVKKMILANLWTSGWSFRPVPRVFHIVFALIVFMGAGGFLAGLARGLFRRQRVWPPAGHCALLCLLTWVMVCGGAYLHGLSSLAAYRSVIYTPSYYAMPGFPAFIALLLMAFQGYGGRWTAAAGALIGLYILTEWYCLLVVATPHWAHSSAPGEICARLASVHPLFPSPLFFAPLCAAYAAILTTVLVAAVRSGGDA